MGIKYENERDGALKDFSLVDQRTCSSILEKVTWMLWELAGRKEFSTFVFLEVVHGSYSISKVTIYMELEM